jgi:hypothetical protein
LKARVAFCSFRTFRLGWWEWGVFLPIFVRKTRMKCSSFDLANL